MTSYKFKVGKAPFDDIGLGRVRVHYTRREGGETIYGVQGFKRQKIVLASVLGHEDEPDKILLDIDQRSDLGVAENTFVDLQLTQVGFCGRVCWYLSVLDPAVQVPAWLAV